LFSNPFSCGAPNSQEERNTKKDAFYSNLDPEMISIICGIKLLENKLKNEKQKWPFIIEKCKNVIKTQLGAKTPTKIGGKHLILQLSSIETIRIIRKYPFKTYLEE
jgi:hypothetical protein